MNLGPNAGNPAGQRGPSPAPPPPPPQDGPDLGPARTKRSARAYHADAPAQAASDGWNDAPAQPNQAPYQRAAADRVAGYGAEQERYLSGESDAALDQIPGQQNVISSEQQAANRARLQQMQSQHGGHLEPPAGAPGVFSQEIGTPDFGPDPNMMGAPPAVGPGQQGNIPQPPHSAGQRLPGVRSKISQEQTPSPVKAQDADQEDFDKEWYFTLGRGGLPRSTTDFGAVDQGE